MPLSLHDMDRELLLGQVPYDRLWRSQIVSHTSEERSSSRYLPRAGDVHRSAPRPTIHIQQPGRSSRLR